MSSKFLWGNQQKECSVQWISWEKIGKQEWKGGLGFRDLENFILALLAKQERRFIQYPNTMVVVIFRGKYY